MGASEVSLRNKNKTKAPRIVFQWEMEEEKLLTDIA